ncbi:hypothetical protein Tco_0596297 [Tanacetum coccineum]
MSRLNVDVHAPGIIAPIPEAVAPELCCINWFTSSTYQLIKMPATPIGISMVRSPNWMKIKKEAVISQYRVDWHPPYLTASRPMTYNLLFDVVPWILLYTNAFAEWDLAGCQGYTQLSTSGSIQFWVIDLKWSSKAGEKRLRYPIKAYDIGFFSSWNDVEIGSDRTFNLSTRNINWRTSSLKHLGRESQIRLLWMTNLVVLLNDSRLENASRLSSDITSKEATLQVVYDVLKLTPFYKAFQVTADAPEIYMQEFWASAYVHNRSVRFKMNNKKHIIGLEQFRDILQICPKVGNKKFVDPPLETEIIIFLASLGHSGDIRKLSDVNVI